VVGVTVDGAGMAAKAKMTVSRRMTLSHSRRMRQRGQSLYITGAKGSGEAMFSRGGEAGRGEESGQNTALTRRGLTASQLS